MELPEKIDIIKKSTIVIFGNGFDSLPTAEKLDLERGLTHLNDQINQLIDYLEEKENFHSEIDEMMFKEEDVSIEQGFNEEMYWVRTKSLYASQAEAEAAREALLKLKN